VPRILRWHARRARGGKTLRLLFVYISEAHAADTWPMGYSVQWPQPTSLAQRCEYARAAAEGMGLEPAFRVVVDPMAGPFNRAFAPWPQGVYAVRAGRLAYIGEDTVMEGDGGCYNVKNLFDFCRDL
jgi:hypothetical protein